MLFSFTIFYVCLSLIRPFELITALHGEHIMLITGGIGLLFFFLSAAAGKVQIFKNGTDQLIVLFVIAIAFSHLRHSWFGGALESVEKFLPTLTGYFLVTHGIKTKKQLNIFFIFLTACVCFWSIEGIIQVNAGISHFGVKPIYETSHGLHNEIIKTIRIKWLGTFSDPNDLAMAMVIPIPFLLEKILNKKFILSIGPLILICCGIFLTNSRGGMLALIASVFAYFIIKTKSKKGLIVALALSSLIVIFGPSRISNMSTHEASAAGRIDSWYEGYQMFREYPIFGVGKGEYTEYNRLTAHNSFVLVLAELGLFGTFMFTGLFYMPFKFLRNNLWGQGRSNIDPQALGMGAAVYGGYIGMLAAMFFLSRSYVLLPFMMLGLTMATSKVLTNQQFTKQIYTISYMPIFLTMCSFIIFIRVMIKLAL